jgi:hypothetical protein
MKTRRPITTGQLAKGIRARLWTARVPRRLAKALCDCRIGQRYCPQSALHILAIGVEEYLRSSQNSGYLALAPFTKIEAAPCAYLVGWMGGIGHTV